MPETGIPVAVSVAWVARIVLGVTFLVSGSGKLRQRIRDHHALSVTAASDAVTRRQRR